MLDTLLLTAAAWLLLILALAWSRRDDRRLRETVRATDRESAAWAQAQRKQLQDEVLRGEFSAEGAALLELLLKRIEEPAETKVWGSRA